MAGFSGTGLLDFIKDQIGACSSYTRTKMIMKVYPTLKRDLKTFYGPDGLPGTAPSTDPMSIITCDEIGPLYLQDGNGAIKTTYILACVIQSAFNSTSQVRHNPFRESTRSSAIDERKIHHADFG